MVPFIKSCRCLLFQVCQFTGNSRAIASDKPTPPHPHPTLLTLSQPTVNCFLNKNLSFDTIKLTKNIVSASGYARTYAVFSV